MHKLPEAFMPVIKADIQQRGMVHPIIVYSPYEQYQTDSNPVLPDKESLRREILRVYMGHKRVWGDQTRLLAHFCVPCTD